MARSPNLNEVVRLERWTALVQRIRQAMRSPVGVLGVAIGVSVLCGLALHPRVFVLAGGLSLVVALGICWPWLTIRGIRAQIGFEVDRASEGESVAVTGQVSNHLPWPVLGLVFDEAGERIRPGRVAASSRVCFRWRLSLPVRGEYPRVLPQVSTGFPFGIWEADRSVQVSNRLLVWPRTFPVGPVPDLGGVEAADGAVTRNRVGSLGDLLGVRPYRQGDSPRRIHWAQTARHDRLIVCEVQSQARPEILLVLDADRAVHTPGAQGSREWAIRVVASLARGWLAAGARVGLACYGTFITPNAGAEQLRRIMDVLALLPDATDVPLAELLASAGVAQAAGRLVVTTDRVRISRSRFDATRFVVLESAGFPGESDDSPSNSIKQATPPSSLTVGAWLTLAGPEQVPAGLQLRSVEARHGG